MPIRNSLTVATPDFNKTLPRKLKKPSTFCVCRAAAGWFGPNYGSSYVRGNLVPWICHNENSLNVYIYPYIYVKVRDRQELGFPLNFIPSNMAKFSKISSHFWKEFEQWKELNPFLTVRDNHPSR